MLKLALRKYTLLVVALAIVASVTCQDCFTGTKKYFLSKYFFPLMTQPDKSGPFVQDPSVNYDLTENKFILTRKLDVTYPNFTAAMGFFQKIYTEMGNNKYFSAAFLDRDGVYSPLFAKKRGLFDGAVQIIGDFKNYFAANLKTSPNDFWDINSPSLTTWCFKNDFTSNIFKFYNTGDVLCNVDDNTWQEVITHLS